MPSCELYSEGEQERLRFLRVESRESEVEGTWGIYLDMS